MARRLEVAQHYTTVQDMLDLPTPVLRVLIWPRPGLLEDHGQRVLATLEFVLGEVEDDLLTGRFWFGSQPGDGEVFQLEQARTDELTLEWIEAQVLAFVEKVLGSE